MSPLSQTLLDPARRPAVVESLVRVVDAEVAAKSGIGGKIIKTGYAAVTKISDGFTAKAVNRLLPGFAQALDPFWAERGTAPFADTLVARQDEAAEALLAVTDGQVAGTSNAVVRKVYGSLRSKARENVVAALPRVGAAIEEQAS
ncbi:hypothetical protein MWU75_17100 [Ornithinimicrobium sp. F0845]|uniref:DUF6918 family protein n=1 Tax=Ornithinimicrobium sp. F0845 TaxID=2926412 RepID=UPI001FF362DF|nr:hypothetical protein [Ornithinimicrobium sp. F0845]MCK0113866.1 hypothetical protein [Ornithinimicrobium sp. F0845]